MTRRTKKEEEEKEPRTRKEGTKAEAVQRRRLEGRDYGDLARGDAFGAVEFFLFFKRFFFFLQRARVFSEEEGKKRGKNSLSFFPSFQK